MANKEAYRQQGAIEGSGIGTQNNDYWNTPPQDFSSPNEQNSCATGSTGLGAGASNLLLKLGLAFAGGIVFKKLMEPTIKTTKNDRK